MPNKLKNLRITKVDFVDAGANQRANIAIVKHAPEESAEPEPSFIEKASKAFSHMLAKCLGEAENVKKDDGGAKTFGAVNGEMQIDNICEEIWDVTDALRRSFVSILRDDSVTDKAATLKQSLLEFNAYVTGLTDTWGQGAAGGVAKSLQAPAITRADVDTAKAWVAKQEAFLDKVDDLSQQMLGQKETSETVESSADLPEINNVNTEEDTEMKIDKSKLTPSELAFLESIEKRYAVDNDENVEKAAPTPKKEPVQKSTADVLKEIAPGLSDMLQGIQKRLESQEDNELFEIAKRYELLGKKPEELAPILKSTKKASEEAYKQVIATLDSALDIAKRSPLFKEVGSNGNGGSTDAEAQIAKRAAEIRQANPKLNEYEARDQAFQEHPELIKEFE